MHAHNDAKINTSISENCNEFIFLEQHYQNFTKTDVIKLFFHKKLQNVGEK
jgi:hypothetical protein